MSAAAAPALKPHPPLSEARALEILNAMPYLVAASCAVFRPGAVVTVAYEVEEDKRRYVFPEQPFRVIREITKLEYLQALPPQLRRVRILSKHYYEIFTD